MNTITTNREGYDSKKSERKNSGEHSTIEKGIQELAEAYYSGKRENPRNKKPKLDIESTGLSSIHNMKRNDYEYENEESFMEYFESSKHDLSKDMNKNVDLDIMEELVRLAMENGAVFLFQCLKVGDDIMKLKQSNEDVQQYEGVLECIKSDFLNIDKELLVYYDLSPLDQKHTLQPDVVLGFKSKHRKIVKILSGLEDRLQFLKKRIANHYINKEQESQRQKIRMEILAKKEEQKKNKIESGVQEQGKTEEKQETIQENLDSPSAKKEAKITHLIDKKTTRVNNLLDSSKKGKLTSQQLAEIGKIEDDIKEIEVNNESIQEKISGIQDMIDQIYLNLERAMQSNDIQDVALIKKMQESRENTKKFPKDEQLITYLNGILDTFNHSLSSTKHKDVSYADGSFIANIFRPFIHSILNEILDKGKIDTRNGISWAKFIEIFENNCDDVDKARTHFRGILKKYNTITTDYYTLFFDLSMAIDEFSNTTFFSRQNGNELNNFSDKYEEFMKTIQ